MGALELLNFDFDTVMNTLSLWRCLLFVSTYLRRSLFTGVFIGCWLPSQNILYSSQYRCQDGGTPGGMLGWVRVTYLLFTRCCQAGALELDCHSQLKPRPVSGAGGGCSRRGRVYLGLVLQVCTVTSHVTSVTRCSGGTLTVYTDTLQCLRCDLLWGPHCFLWTLEARIVSEGGHYCHYGQLNHLTWCGVTYWWCAAPCLFLAPSSARCFLLCSFIGVLHSPRP